MDKAKRVVKSFLNSAEGYFHTRRVLKDQVKQPRDLYGPMGDRPERWDYTDIRNIKLKDIDHLLTFAFSLLDKELYQKIPSTALHAALQYAIDYYDSGRFKSKFDATKYNFLFKVLALKAQGRK